MSDNCCTSDGSCSSSAAQTTATAEGISTAYTVTGMTCSHCKSSVTEALTEIDGVLSVDVDVHAGRVAVTTSGEPDDDAFTKAVDEAGYELTGRAA